MNSDLLHLQYRGTAIFVQMNEEGDGAATAGRRRRSPQVPFPRNNLVALPRDVKNTIERYLEWRRRNGYGQLTRRWGK